MKIIGRRTLPGILALLVSGCALAPRDPGAAQASADNVFAQVVAMAAPDQDVASARLLPEDNCYWYEHRGPVETTLLPLRTRNGNPICMS